MSQPKVDILVVDDSPDQLVALNAILSDLDINVVEASSGREALRWLLRRDFALVLLDIQMPLMDGFETAALIRQRKRSEHTPIIFLTAHGDETHAAQGYSLGAVDYILAPLNPDVLRTKVAVFVDLFRKTEEVARHAESLRSHAARLRRLADAALAIHAAASAEELLKVAADAALEVASAEQVVIEVMVESNEPGRMVRPRTIAIGRPSDAPWWLLALEGLRDGSSGALRLGAAELEATLAATPPAGVGGEPPLGGWLAVPVLTREGQKTGWIQLSHPRGAEFSTDDEALIVQLARIVSIAIENTVYRHARQANRAKDEFLATLSHELRTPLQAIMSWSALLREDPVDAAALERGLDVIERSAKAQAELIDELLDVSRIVTGKLELEPSRVDLSAILEAATDAARPAAIAGEIDLRRSGSSASLWVRGDPQRLQQVMGNLLSNAVKFTPAGGQIDVRLERLAEVAEIRVLDTGVGIRSDFLPHLFERFRQADSSSTRTYGGLGIGLAVVRHLVELHGGSVRAESPGDGAGATFIVTLPALAAAEVDLSGSAEASERSTEISDGRLDGLQIVVVDDQPETLECVSLALQRRGATVYATRSAGEALGRLDAAVDALLSDIAMPGQDGIQLIRAVRARDAERGTHTPAAALSAYARSEEATRALAAGFDLHIAKPVDEITLVEGVLELQRRRGLRRQ